MAVHEKAALWVMVAGPSEGHQGTTYHSALRHAQDVPEISQSPLSDRMQQVEHWCCGCMPIVLASDDMQALKPLILHITAAVNVHASDECVNVEPFVSVQSESYVLSVTLYVCFMFIFQTQNTNYTTAYASTIKLYVAVRYEYSINPKVVNLLDD